jgi:hypothetical protein
VAVTTESIARSALAAIGSDASLLLAATWVSERYQNIVSRIRFRSLRRVGEFIAPATYTTGTVTATQGSNVIIGTNTLWTGDLEGRHFRPKTNWYRISKVVSATELHLDSEFVENTITNNSYRICARYINLPGRWLGPTIVQARLRRAITIISLDAMDISYPGRILQNATIPIEVCELGDTYDANGNPCKQIELYPASTNDELFYFIYWDLPGDLRALSSVIPQAIDLFVLKEGVLIDAMRLKASQAADKGQQEIAAFWRNEYRMQETAWEKKILLAMQADKGVDDTSFIFQSMRAIANRLPSTVRTAREEIYARGVSLR